MKTPAELLDYLMGMLALTICSVEDPKLARDLLARLDEVLDAPPTPEDSPRLYRILANLRGELRDTIEADDSDFEGRLLVTVRSAADYDLTVWR